jgi:hypothetical protein
VGSVLCAINNEFLLQTPYLQVVEQLKNWEPPLTLSFRQAPEKIGYLKKKVNTSLAKENSQWKVRFFILGEGKLSYKKTDSEDSFIRDGFLYFIS